MALAAILVAAAAGFAVLNGANNGSTLVAIATTSTSLLPVTAIAVLAGGVVLGPLLLGTAVATTLSTRLVDARGPVGEQAFLVGILAAMAVIGLLAWQRLPSSLTLATIGGLAGAGIASGLHMSWTVAVLAVALAVAVPLVTGVVTFGISRGLLATGPAMGYRGLDRRRLRWFRDASFALQALAYATNDGQRMLAVLIVALRAGWPGDSLDAPLYAALALAFALGAVLGTRRMAHGSPAQLAPAGTFERSIASVMASFAAFSSSLLGIPVSMTQTTSAALVGAHATVGARRVRWEEATKLLTAWVLTLPASAAAGAAGSFALGWVK